MQDQPELVVEVERGWARPVVLVPVFGLISLIAGALPSFSVGANLLVLCVGGTLFWLGLSHHVPRREAPPRLPRQTLWWLVPLGVLVGMEATNYLSGSTPEHPTLSRLADPVLDGYLARAGLYFGWLSAFWAMVRR